MCSSGRFRPLGVDLHLPAVFLVVIQPKRCLGTFDLNLLAEFNLGQFYLHLHSGQPNSRPRTVDLDLSSVFLVLCFLPTKLFACDC